MSTFNDIVVNTVFWEGPELRQWNNAPSNNILWDAGTTDDFKVWFFANLQIVYENSETARKLLNDWVSAGNKIRVVESIGGGPGFVSGFDGSGDMAVALNPSSIEEMYYFNENGTYVREKAGLTIIHELIHYIDRTLDLVLPAEPYDIPLDPSTITDADQNVAGFDDRGVTLKKQNDIAREIGQNLPDWLNNIQAAYLGSRAGPWVQGKNYTDGHSIDVARHGDKTRNTSGINNVIAADDRDEVASNDLYFGLDGQDEIRAGAGNDHLFGGSEADRLFGEEGRDRLFGGGGDDTLDGGRGSDFIQGGTNGLYTELANPFRGKNTDGGLNRERDGNDTVEYKGDDYSGGIEVGIGASDAEAGARALDSQNPDLSRVITVKDLGHTDEMDYLLSIEKIIGSSADDRVRIDNLKAELLAGSDKQGGIDIIDLGESKKNGDTIDASRVADTQSLSINLETGRVALRNNSTVGLTVLNAENAYGGAGNDLITGNGQGNELVGGAGKDEIIGGDGNDILWSSTKDATQSDGSDDILRGGKGADVYNIDSTGDRVYDPDQSEGEGVFLLGKQLTGGKSTKENPNVYFAEDGTRYTYVANGGGGSPLLAFSSLAAAGATQFSLEITSPDGTVVYVDEFLNGEAGIWLRDPEDDESIDPESFQSPLVLDLGGDGIGIAQLASQTVHFDFEGDGFGELTAWIDPADGFLALDRNGNGLIDDGSELFGSNPTDVEELPVQGGMARLAQLDSNFDGQISAADVAFADLRIWQDLNSNGLTDEGELASLVSLGIASIDLDYAESDTRLPDAQITERSSFIRADGTTSEIADVWFRTIPTASLARQQVEVDADILGLPYIGGSGVVRDLHSAMQLDPLLEEMVNRLTQIAPENFADFAQLAEAIFLRWTGADSVRIDSRGPFINAQLLTAIENWTGDKFIQQRWSDSTNPYPQSAAALTIQYRNLLANFAAKLFAQIPAGDELLPELSYHMDAFLVLDPGFSIAGFIDRMAALSPTDGADRWAFWKGISEVGAGLANRAGMDLESFESLVDSALATIDPQITFHALSRLYLGSDENDRIIGNSNELDFDGGLNPDWTLPYLGGVDWILPGAGDDVIATGYGRDTILFGIGSGHDRVQEGVRYSVPGFGSQEHSPTEIVQLLGNLTHADIETSIVPEGSLTIARIQIAGQTDVLDFVIHSGLESITIIDWTGAPVVFDVSTGELTTITLPLTLDELLFESVMGYALKVKAPDGTELALIRDYYTTSVDAVAFMLGSTPIRLSDIDAELLSRSQTSGNDEIAASPRADVIAAQAGNDVVNAGKGDDTIDGGAGADLLRGGRGIDTYLFGRGSGVDTISDPFGLNRVRFGSNIALTQLQLAYGPSGNDLVIRIAGTNDQLVIFGEFPQGSGGIELFEFEDGSTVSRAQILAMLLPPPLSQESPLQLGTGGQDILRASGSFTVAAGGEARDTYIFNRGDGVMWIGDGDFDDINSTDADILQFGEGIGPEDLELRMLPQVVGDYLSWYSETAIEVRIKGTDDAVRIFNFSPFWTYDQGGLVLRDSALDTIRFADGQVWNLDQIFLELQKGTPGDDHIWAWFEDAIIDGGPGNDRINIDNASRLVDVAQVLFGRDSDQDLIPGFGMPGSTQHTIVFGNDVTLDDIAVRVLPRISGSDFMGFEIGIAGSDARLTIERVGEQSRFKLGDGTLLDVWDLAQIALDQAVNSEAQSVINVFRIPSWDGASEILTLRLQSGMGSKQIVSGNVNIELPSGATLPEVVWRSPTGGFVLDLGNGDSLALPDLALTQGNPPAYTYPVNVRDETGSTFSNSAIVNELRAGGANVGTTAADIFEGRPTNDWFVTNGGADVIRFGYGSGHDSFSGTARIEFRNGVDLDDLDLKISGSVYTLTLAGSSDALSFGLGQLTSVGFADGPNYSRQEFIYAFFQRQQPTAGDDTFIVPSMGVPGASITPGPGNDIVRISDVELRFARGDGHDEYAGSKIFLTDVHSIGEIMLTYSYYPEFLDSSGMPYVEEYRDWYRAYEIVIRDTGDSIRLGSLQPTITLASGQVITFGQLYGSMADQALTNQSDDYTVPAYDWGTILDGGMGDDRIDGHLSEDIYLFGYGDGEDTIIENGLWDDYFFDVIRFKDGVLPEDVGISINANGEMVFALDDSNDRIILPSFSNRMFRPGIEQVEFADGMVWTMEQILADLPGASAGDDVLIEPTAQYEIPDQYSNRVSGLFDGGAGNDFLAGGAGSDFYVFGRGYGEDTIFEQSPMPLFVWVYGDDEYDGAYPDPERDVLTFLPGIAALDLQFLRGGTTGDDLIIQIRGTNDRVTITGQFAPLAVQNTMMLGYDYEWALDDANGNGIIEPAELNYVAARYLASSPNGIEAIRLSTQQELSRDEIAALVEGVDNSGDNIYIADEIGGTLDGGTGNDILYGSANDDDFVFQRGYGDDAIHDQGGHDIVRFGEGIYEEWLHFSRAGEAGEDLLIEVDGPERLTLTVADQFAQLPPTIEEFSFLTGRMLTWLDVQEIILAQERTSGDDDIVGFLTGDIVDGGDGDDLLTGGKGDDTVIGGSGRDTAVYSGSRSDYLIEQVDGAVRVTDLRADADGTDTLHGVEELRFAGGSGETISLVDPNRAPIVSGEIVSATEEQRLTILRPALLANDSDPDGDAIDLALVQNAVGGRVWINLDGNVVFEPLADFFGEGSFEYIVTDGRGGQTVGHVTIAVSGVADAPRLSGVFQDVEVDEDSAINVLVPTGLFTDPDGDLLMLSARSADGSPLPEWLSFDQGRLTGIPPANFNGELGIVISATDGGSEVSTQFALTVRPVNDAPTVTNALSDTQVERGSPFELVLPDSLFADVDGDELELAARLSDGSSLPDWLSFDGQRFVGTVPADFQDQLEIEVFASDGDELVSDVFSLLAPSNSPPVVQDPIGEISFEEDQPISFTIPASAFSDADGDALTYTLAQADGSALPEWLTFDGTALSGQPPVNFNGQLALRLTASDGEFSAVQTFGLTITPVNDAPTVTQPIGDVLGAEDNPIDFTVPSETFADIDSETLSLSARLLGGDPLPAWLQFEGGRFTGTPPTDFNGYLDLEVIASDGQAVATDAFRLTINPVNDPPVVVQPLSDVSTSEGETISIAIPAGAFNDVDGDQITYTASLASGDALPSWLTFDNGTVSGLIPYDAAGTYDIRVAASDGQSSAVDTFLLTVANTNRSPVATNDGLFITLQAEALLILASELLANDTDPDGNPLSIVSVSGAAQGSVAINADGNIVYTPDGAFLGNDSFTYVLSDGSVTTSAQVSVRVDDPFATWSRGTEGPDSLFGNMQAENRLYGLGGDDHIKGGQLDDWLAGGSGNDKIEGLGGNDHMWGMGGNDQLIGNNDFDTAYYFGLRSSFSITTSNGSVSVVDNAPTVDGDEGTDTILNIELLSFKGGETLSIASPIILDLDGNGVRTVSAAQSKAKFDMDGDGLADDTSWISSGDAYLFLDRDGNATLSGINEMSFTGDLPGAATDLAGLKAFDSNNDGLLSSADARFNDFRAWRDGDGDGAVDSGEVLTLGAINLASINLTGTANSSSAAPGEAVIVNNGSWTRTNGSTAQLADAAMTFFSAAASPLASLTPSILQLDRRASRYQLSSAGGAITLELKKADGFVDSRAGRIGILSSFEFKGRDFGLLSPIVLDLDGDGLELVKSKKSHARFDMDGDGSQDRTGWIGNGDGFLVIDRNNDGKITSNSELTFGLEDADAQSSLEALGALDSNNDGKIDASDARFGELRIWKDSNGNGVTDAGELLSLGDAGVTSISLAAAATEDTARIGNNIVRSTATFTRSNGSVGTVGDVGLGFRPADAAATDPLAHVFDRLRELNLVNGEAGRWDRLPRGLAELLGETDEGPVGLPDLQASLAADMGVAISSRGRTSPTAAVDDADLERRLAAMAQDLAAFGAGSAARIDVRQWHRDGPVEFFAA